MEYKVFLSIILEFNFLDLLCFNNIYIQAGFAEPHSSLTIGWVGVGLELGWGWDWVGVGLVMGLGWRWVGVGSGMGLGPEKSLGPKKNLGPKKSRRSGGYLKIFSSFF